jgi:hypothetical protein
MRAVRRLIIALLVLAVLFVAADRIGVAVAESQAAAKIQSSRGLNKKPSVAIEGFPFLTQVAAQQLDDVRVAASGLTVQDGTGGQITVQSFNADLRGVKLQNGFSPSTVQSATGTALISYADLSAAMPHSLSASYGGNGKVKLTGSVEGFQASALADIQATSGDSIGLSNAGIQDVSGVSGLLGDAVRSALKQLVDSTTLKIADFPVGLRLQAIAAQPDGVQVTLTGTDLSFTG